MRLAPFLCLGGVELANMARVTSYGTCTFFDNDCPCPALDEQTFDSPSTDPAPWYDANYPESAEFLGLLPSSITISPAATRSTSAMFREGATIGPERLGSRVIEVVGWMVSETPEGMWWGERWLTEALRGTPCTDCVTDTLEVLPFCRPDDGIYDFTEDFRTLVCAATVAGPRFSELSDSFPEMVVETQFQIVSQMPWLYGAKETCMEDEPVALESSGMPGSCALTTTQWMDGTFYIAVTATSAVTDLVIQGQVSLDGECPVEAPGSSVPPCFTYTVGAMNAGDTVVIDGRRRQAHYIDGGERFSKSLLPYLDDWEGPFIWPDAGLCTTLCLTIDVGSGSATATVESYLRTL